MKEIEVIQGLIESIRQSVEVYEAKTSHYNDDREHSRTSIQRRIMVAREELLKLSKQL